MNALSLSEKPEEPKGKSIEGSLVVRVKDTPTPTQDQGRRKKSEELKGKGKGVQQGLATQVEDVLARAQDPTTSLPDPGGAKIEGRRGLRLTKSFVTKCVDKAKTWNQRHVGTLTSTEPCAPTVEQEEEVRGTLSRLKNGIRKIQPRPRVTSRTFHVPAGNDDMPPT